MTPKKIFIITLLLVLSVSGMAFAKDRIVGGSPGSITNWPWIAGLVIDGSGLCGGTLIAPNWILTAGHCTYGVASIEARMGADNLLAQGERITSSQIIPHPNYNPNTLDNDIGLVQLSQSSAQTPLSSWGNAAIEGGNASVAGWGTTSFGGTASVEQLLQVDVPVVSNTVCEQSYMTTSGGAYPSGFLTNNMLCAGFAEGGKDACQGDSGGPLVQSGSLIGVVSWGEGCAYAGFYGIYTRVANYVAWIESYVGTTTTPTTPAEPTTPTGPATAVTGWWPGMAAPTNVGVKVDLGQARPGWYFGGSLLDLVNQVGGSKTGD